MRQAQRITKKILFNFANSELRLTEQATDAIREAQGLMFDYEMPPGRQEEATLQVAKTGLMEDDAPEYLLRLAALVACVFCCKVVAYRSWRGRYSVSVVFVGINPAVTIAARAFEGLRDQLILSRQYYISTLPEVVRDGLVGKQRLGDEWSLKWVNDLSERLIKCIINPDHLALINDWLSNELPTVIGDGCVIDFEGSANLDPNLNCPPEAVDPCACQDVDWSKLP